MAGFLSGLTEHLFGGSNQSSGSQSQSGWGLLPSEIQNTFTNFANNVNSQIPNAGSAYTPLPQTAEETQGINQLKQGFAPTAQSLNSDVSMLMNPFNNSVIDELNRQANSGYSILKQNATENGQFGSNRQQLGANDIENSRQSAIGSLLQNQYNTAIGQIFDKIIPQRQQDTQNLFNIGNFQRTLAGQQNQAPIAGLQEIAKALGILPTSGGSTATSSSEGQTQNGIFKSIGLGGSGGMGMGG